MSFSRAAGASHRSLTYRPDIDGLRAVAVLAVIGFHARFGFLRGGFAGVDVFFVISGFLISGIIVEALKKGTFSFGAFYARRVIRLFPALAVVLAATLLLGWPILYPGEFKALGRHTAAAAGFVSNFVLWSEAGYFDSPMKPLLHLWSLGVEEQFYLAWPLVLVIAWKRRWNLTIVAAIIVLASFTVNVIAVATSHGNAAFFSPATRMWEILAGGILFLSLERGEESNPRSRDILSIAGLILLALSFTATDAEVAWPGWRALMPVSGTLCIIAAGSGSFVNRRILSHRWLVGIGLISYPLYLWHWPLLVYGWLVGGEYLARLPKLGIIALAFVLAWLTYEYVEKPFRKGSRKRKKAITLLVPMAFAGIAGIAVDASMIRPRISGGATAEIEAAIDDYTARGSFTAGGNDLRRYSTGSGSTSVAVIGDSHAAQYFGRFEKLVQQGRARQRVVFLTYGGCPPLPGVNHAGLSWDGAMYRCDKVHSISLDFALRPEVTTVVYSAWWETYFDYGALYFTDDPARRVISREGPLTDSVFAALERELAGLRARGRTVFIVLSNPTSDDFDAASMLPPRIGRSTRSIPSPVPRSDAEAAREPIAARLRGVAERTGSIVIDPFEMLCDSVNCPAVDNRGLPIYRDNHHVRASWVRDHGWLLDRIVAPTPRDTLPVAGGRQQPGAAVRLNSAINE